MRTDVPCCTVDTPAEDNKPFKSIAIEGSKVTSAIFGPYDDTFITGHENGTVKLWDMKTYETLKTVDDQHDNVVNDIQMAHDRSAIITASKDTTAKVCVSVRARAG